MKMSQWKILTYEQVGKLVYLSLKADRKQLEEGLEFYSDFDEEELLQCEKDPLRIPDFGNGIGVKTINIFDESCLLAIGVYGEDFTEVFNLSNNFIEEEVVSDIVGWFKTMEIQTNNTKVLVHRTETMNQTIIHKQEEINARLENQQDMTEKQKNGLKMDIAYVKYLLHLFS